MRRREFITLLGSAAAAWPLAARAQQTAKLPTIGLVGGAIPSTQGVWIAAFVQRLRELGWLENRTVAIEVRWAEGRNERYSEIVAEFVRLKVDVIVTQGTPATIAAKQVTSVIPIVFVAAADPVWLPCSSHLLRLPSIRLAPAKRDDAVLIVRLVRVPVGKRLNPAAA